jgi:hypothetical protein
MAKILYYRVQYLHLEENPEYQKKNGIYEKRHIERKYGSQPTKEKKIVVCPEFGE